MKKVFLTLAVVFGMIASANAQLVIGGQLNFSAGTSKTMWSGDWGAQTPLGAGNKTSYFGFGIAPQVGYLLNEKMEVGGKLVLDYSHDNYFTVIENKDGKSAAKYAKDYRIADFSWSINPYFRYRLFDVQGFAMWMQAEAALGTSIERKAKYYAYGDDNMTSQRTEETAKNLNKTADGHKYSNFKGGLYIKPVLTYTFQEHWVLISELNFLSLGLWGNVEKITEKAMDRAGNDASIVETNNTCNFNLGLFRGDVVSIGMAYKF